MTPVDHLMSGVAVPTLAELRERATVEARAVLDCAARLVAVRMAEQAAIHAAIARLCDPPWAEGARPWSAPRGDLLLPTDLARALVAREPRRLVALMFRDGDLDDLDAQTFGAATRRWQGADAGDEPPLALPRGWAREWAWALRRRDTALDVDVLLSTLGKRGVRALAEFSRRHREGLITLDEAADHITHRMARAGRSSSLARFVPAHLDHDGALARTIAALLSSEGGVALVGEPGSGRTCLLHALRLRMFRGAVPDELARRGMNVDNFHGGPATIDGPDGPVFIPPAAVFPGAVYVLTSRVLAGLCGPEAPNDDGDMLRLLRHCVDLCRRPVADFRLIVAVTPAEHECLLTRVPGLAALPRIDVSPPPITKAAAMWLCRGTAIEQRTGHHLTLLSVLAGLHERPREVWLDFTHDDDMRLETGPSIALSLERRLRSEQPAAMHRRLAARLPTSVRLLEPEELADLLELERALLGDPPPLPPR